jgi:hypothetical protein
MPGITRLAFLGGLLPMAPRRHQLLVRLHHQPGLSPYQVKETGKFSDSGELHAPFSVSKSAWETIYLVRPRREFTQTETEAWKMNLGGVLYCIRLVAFLGVFDVIGA